MSITPDTGTSSALTPPSDPAIETFKNRRRKAAWLFTVGILALLAHASVLGAEFSFSFETPKEAIFRVMALAGLVALGAGIVFTSLVGNCPSCHIRFSTHPDYSDGNVPVLNRIAECPFCRVQLEA